MEYYSGYLMPVRMVPPKTKPCKDARKVRRSLQRDICCLESRVQSMEGKFRRNRKRSCESVQSSCQCQDRVRQPGKLVYRVIQNEYYDYNMKEENKRLREENRLLNEYFEVFSVKHRQSNIQLQKLKEQNSKLRKLVSKGGLVAKQPNTDTGSAGEGTALWRQPYVYDVPPYGSSAPQAGGIPRLQIFNDSDLCTKANYEDSSMDIPRSDRSALKTVRSGLL